MSNPLVQIAVLAMGQLSPVERADVNATFAEPVPVAGVDYLPGPVEHYEVNRWQGLVRRNWWATCACGAAFEGETFTLASAELTAHALAAKAVA